MTAAEHYCRRIVPTVKGIPGPYRVYFYSSDCNEPAHVHVQRDRGTCKFWLDPVSLAFNDGLARRDIAAIRRVIFEYRARIQEAWREHCDTIE